MPSDIVCCCKGETYKSWTWNFHNNMMEREGLVNMFCHSIVGLVMHEQPLLHGEGMSSLLIEWFRCCPILPFCWLFCVIEWKWSVAKIGHCVNMSWRNSFPKSIRDDLFMVTGSWGGAAIVVWGASDIIRALWATQSDCTYVRCVTSKRLLK